MKFAGLRHESLSFGFPAIDYCAFDYFRGITKYYKFKTYFNFSKIVSIVYINESPDSFIIHPRRGIMFYRELQELQRDLPDEMVVFERQRLLNLIDSKVKRREIESAVRFAEELFKKEVKYALIRRTRVLTKYSDMLWQIIVVLLNGFFVFTVLTVLNIRPFFSLAAEVVALIGIVSGVVVEKFLAKRLAKAVEIIMDVYETRREAFVERVLTDGMECIDSEDWLTC
jgi:hypothetical protein